VIDSPVHDLEQFLQRRLNQPLPGAAAQRRFATRPSPDGWAPELQPDTARRAAALLLLYPGATGPHLPLTVRRHDLPQHAGQVSLPGGAQDPGESSAETALREAREEVGIATDGIRLLGPLSTIWIPVSNFLVTPIVGVIDQRPDFMVHAGEVAQLLELPLTHLRDDRHVAWGQRPRGGAMVAYPYIAFGGHRIWGATAMILSEFISLFDDDEADAASRR
jgi:8-oxo-dGTP pyrophosphatase MutT (NUDIX family)